MIELYDAHYVVDVLALRLSGREVAEQLKRVRACKACIL
jgi:hypothetical protein